MPERTEAAETPAVGKAANTNQFPPLSPFEFIVNPLWLKVLAYVVAFAIASFNGWLLVRTFRGG